METKDNQLKKIDSEISEIKERMADPDLAKGTALTYSRITGYYRVTDNWNTGKAQEFKDRKLYSFN
jgi:ribonucleoside-triphosphate reductase (formate)